MIPAVFFSLYLFNLVVKEAFDWSKQLGQGFSITWINFFVVVIALWGVLLVALLGLRKWGVIDHPSGGKGPPAPTNLVFRRWRNFGMFVDFHFCIFCMFACLHLCICAFFSLSQFCISCIFLFYFLRFCI